MADYSDAYRSFSPPAPTAYSVQEQVNSLAKRVTELEKAQKKTDSVSKVSAMNVIAETELEEAYERIAKLEKEKSDLIKLISKLREAGNEMALVLRDIVP